MKTTLKYGWIACAIVVGIPALSMAILGTGSDGFDKGEIIGYSSIIVAMGLVYFAMRHFRDKENDGTMSFGEGMKIGLLISTMGGLAWGIYNLIFVKLIMPNFYEEYYAHQSGYAIGSPEFEQGFAQMKSEMGFWVSDFGVTLLMFLTVFIIGVVISLISAIIVQRKPMAVA